MSCVHGYQCPKEIPLAIYQKIIINNNDLLMKTGFNLYLFSQGLIRIL